jgi:hypothetical protein
MRCGELNDAARAYPRLVDAAELRARHRGAGPRARRSRAASAATALVGLAFWLVTRELVPRQKPIALAVRARLCLRR